MFLITNGDDNYKALSRMIIAGMDTTIVFHPKITALVMKEMFGYEVTTADKGEIQGWQTAEEADFLKRKFVSSEGIIMCPSKLSDIQQKILWINSNSALPLTTQFVFNVHNALREFFFHGRKIFDQHKKILNPFLESIGPSEIFHPTYDDMLALYMGEIRKD